MTRSLVTNIKGFLFLLSLFSVYLQDLLTNGLHLLLVSCQCRAQEPTMNKSLVFLDGFRKNIYSNPCLLLNANLILQFQNVHLTSPLLLQPQLRAQLELLQKNTVTQRAWSIKIILTFIEPPQVHQLLHTDTPQVEKELIYQEHQVGRQEFCIELSEWPIMCGFLVTKVFYPSPALVRKMFTRLCLPENLQTPYGVIDKKATNEFLGLFSKV